MAFPQSCLTGRPNACSTQTQNSHRGWSVTIYFTVTVFFESVCHFGLIRLIGTVSTEPSHILWLPNAPVEFILNFTVNQAESSQAVMDVNQDTTSQRCRTKSILFFRADLIANTISCQYSICFHDLIFIFCDICPPLISNNKIILDLVCETQPSCCVQPVTMSRVMGNHTLRSFFVYDTDCKIVLCCLHRLYFIVSVKPKEGLAETVRQ